MKKLRNIVGAWTAILAFGLQSSAFGAIGLNGLDFNWGRLGNDFVIENQQFRGNWSESHTWDGTLCNGSYAYNIDLNGLTHAVDFEVNDESSLTATANLRDIHFGVDGTYRSSYTACVTTGGWLGVSTDSVKIVARADFGADQDLKDMKVQIQATEFGTIHMGTLVPAWFENFVTKMVNRALVKVWSSRVGDWLSAKITEQIKKKFPDRQ